MNRNERIEDMLKELRRYLQRSAKVNIQTIHGANRREDIDGIQRIFPNGTATIIIQIDGGAKDDIPM